jgi:hypothetical protein
VRERAPRALTDDSEVINMLHRLKMRFIRWAFDTIFEDGEHDEIEFTGSRVWITSSTWPVTLSSTTSTSTGVWR